MSRAMIARGAAALLLVGGAAACTPDAAVTLTPASGTMFDSYVAIGNSIAAGVQSTGINDSTQRQSYAYLVATQSMETRFAVPFIPRPGCTPPIANWQTGALVGGAPAGTCTFRDEDYITTALNNVAVPSAASTEVVAPVSQFHNVLTMLILGGKTQGQRALDADPTFVSIQLAENDALQAAYTGVLYPMAGVSRGITPFETFKTNYDSLLSQLKNGAPRLQGGVLFATIQTGAAPILFPSAAFSNPLFYAGFSMAATGSPTGLTVLPNCTNSTTLVSFAILPQIRAYMASSGASGHPPVISCEKGQFAPSAAVGEIFILDATEQATLQAAVDAYNDYIEAQATAMNFAYFDPNPTLVAQKAPGGCIKPFPDLGAAPTVSPFGSCMSFDGLHPSRAGQVLIANGMIDAINAKYGTSLEDVQ